MQHVRILVTKLVSDEFPGWVEFTIFGADGETIRFIDKVPVASASPHSEFPFEANIACNIVQSFIQSDGTVLVEIDTSPWGISTDTGVSRFVVNSTQLVDPPYTA